jgi:hypothetical protein
MIQIHAQEGSIGRGICSQYPLQDSNLRGCANLPRSGDRLSVALLSVIGLGRLVAIEDLGQLGWIGGVAAR